MGCEFVLFRFQFSLSSRTADTFVIMRILLVAALFLLIVVFIEGKAIKSKAVTKHKKTLKSSAKLKSNVAKEVSPKRRSDKTTKASAEEKTEKSGEELPVKAVESKEAKET